MSPLSPVDGMTRDEWLAGRRDGIGASEAAAVFGLHPWISPLGLFYDKTGEVPRDGAEPSEAMEWGLRLEDVVAQAWAEKNGRAISRVRRTIAHPEYPWMLASLDRIAHDPDEDLEIKTASGWMQEDWRDDELPPYVLIQVQWQMAVTGLPRAHVAALLGGCHYVQKPVDRDDEMIAGLIKAGGEFWQRIQAGDPPQADSHPNTSAVLKARWEQTLDEAVEMGDEGVRLVAQRHRSKAAADAMKAEQVEAENRLRQLLGENEVGTVFGEIACTWRPDRNGKRTLRVKEIV